MIPDNVKSIMQSLIDNGHEAYIIGGADLEMVMDTFDNAAKDMKRSESE